MRNKVIILLLTILPILIVYFVLPFLPLEIPMHYDFFGNVTRFGARDEFYLVPFMMTLVGFSFSVYIFKSGKLSTFEQFTMIMSMLAMNLYLVILLVNIYYFQILNLNMTLVVFIIATMLVSVLLLKKISKSK